MDDESTGAGGRNSGAKPGKSARWPGLQAPGRENDDLVTRLRALHDVYAEEDEVPEHLTSLARMVADRYGRVE